MSQQFQKCAFFITPFPAEDYRGKTTGGRYITGDLFILRYDLLGGMHERPYAREESKKGVLPSPPTEKVG